MKQSVYTDNYIDFTKEPLFFGEGRNTQRYDVLKYPFFDELNDKMLAQYWRPDEIDVSRDKRDFENAPQNIKTAYTRVLQKLIFLDSVQGRGMLQTFGNLISNPEFESLATTWEFFENIHSRSYTHILRSVYANPTEIFDQSFELKPLVNLAKGTAQIYDNCYSDATIYLNQCFKNPNAKPDKRLYESLILLMLTINLLEGVRFYSGFSCIWSMHFSQGLFERTSNVLKLICRDENLHLQVTQYLLRLLRDKDEEGFREVYAELAPKIPDIYRAAAEEEFTWIEYLFEDGEYLGMSIDLAKTYIKHITNRRLKALALPTIYEGVAQNPIPWVQKYITYDDVEQLPQETELLTYKFNTLDKYISDDQLKALEKKLSW